MKTFVYVMNALGSDDHKIGFAKDISARRLDLQTGCPRPLKVVWSRKGAQSLEHRIHMFFVDKRGIGEWFTLSPDDLLLLDKEFGSSESDETDEQAVESAFSLRIPQRKRQLFSDKLPQWLADRLRETCRPTKNDATSREKAEKMIESCRTIWQESDDGRKQEIVVFAEFLQGVLSEDHQRRVVVRSVSNAAEWRQIANNYNEELCKTLRDGAICIVEDNADTTWLEAAKDAIYTASLAHSIINRNIVQQHMPKEVWTHNLKAWGAVWQHAARQGWIEKTGNHVESADPSHNLGISNEWRSLIYEEK